MVRSAAGVLGVGDQRSVRHRTGRAAIVLSVLVGAWVLPAAASQPPSPDPVDSAPVEGAVVVLDRSEPAPAEVVIQVGEPVTWVNRSAEPLLLTTDPDAAEPGITGGNGEPGSDRPCDGVESGCLAPGSSGSRTFDRAGTYPYWTASPAGPDRHWHPMTVVVLTAPPTTPPTTGSAPPSPPPAAPGDDRPSPPPTGLDDGVPVAPPAGPVGEPPDPPPPATPPDGSGPPPSTTPPGGPPPEPPSSEPSTTTTTVQPPATTTTTLPVCKAPGATTTTTIGTPRTTIPSGPEPPEASTSTSTSLSTSTSAPVDDAPATTVPAVENGSTAEPDCPPPTTTSTSTSTTTAVEGPAGPPDERPPDDRPEPSDPGPGPTPAGPPTTDPGLDPVVPEPVRSPFRSQGWTAGFPDHLRQLSDSVVRSEPRTTAVLVEAAAELVASGVDPEEAVRRVFGQFPVGGMARYGHDWWYPRYGPGWRLHQGTDVFADHGTPVRAPTAGVVSSGTGALGGLYVRITEADGSYWYLAHLSGLVDGFRSGSPVEEGDVVGYVGNSGNARTTPPHVHVERHPGGGPAVDSKPILDQFLDEAEAALDGAAIDAEPDDPAHPDGIGLTGGALPADREGTTSAGGAPGESDGSGQRDRSGFAGAGGGLAVTGWAGPWTGAVAPPAAEQPMGQGLDVATARVVTAGDGTDPAIVVVAGGLTLGALFGRGRRRPAGTPPSALASLDLR